MKDQNCHTGSCGKSRNFLFLILGVIALVFVSTSVYSGIASDESEEPAPSPTRAVQAAPTHMVAANADYKSGAVQDYSAAAFDKAQKDGKVVLVDFHADWCSTCVSNKPNLKEAFSSLNDSSLVGFIANYDTEKELKKRFGVTSQATFIVFKGVKEVNRTMGALSVDQFKKLLSV